MPPKKNAGYSRRITPISPKKLIKVFEACGFCVDGQSGSHRVMRKQGHRKNIVITVHGGREIQPPLVLDCIKRAGLTREEYFRILDTL